MVCSEVCVFKTALLYQEMICAVEENGIKKVNVRIIIFFLIVLYVFLTIDFVFVVLFINKLYFVQSYKDILFFQNYLGGKKNHWVWIFFRIFANRTKKVTECRILISKEVLL